MNEIIRTYKQESWNKQLDVEIRKGGIVTLQGQEVTTDNEKALANIILRLNGYWTVTHEEVIKLKEEVKHLKDLIVKYEND